MPDLRSGSNELMAAGFACWRALRVPAAAYAMGPGSSRAAYNAI